MAKSRFTPLLCMLLLARYMNPGFKVSLRVTTLWLTRILLSYRQYERLFGSSSSTVGSGILGQMAAVPQARQDFAKAIYEACRSSKGSAGRAVSTKHGTWFVILRNAIQHTQKSDISGEDWVNGLVTAIASAGITWAPGAHLGRLTCTRILQLAGVAKPRQLILAPLGSIKRNAMEAEMRLRSEEQQPKRARRRTIDFGCKLPFQMVPKLILDGFAQHYKTCEQEDTPAVGNHFQAAHNCLISLVAENDWRCDLMLMLALTVAASSVTPKVNKIKLEFEAAKRKKEPDRLAAMLVTRMLWFLKPKAFPSEQNENGILSKRNMTKKMGKCLGHNYSAVYIVHKARSNIYWGKKNTLPTTGRSNFLDG